MYTPFQNVFKNEIEKRERPLITTIRLKYEINFDEERIKEKKKTKKDTLRKT